jgi:hypothetical protein
MNEDLKKYIDFCLERGLKKEEIKEKLLSNGWNDSEIEEAFSGPIKQEIVEIPKQEIIEEKTKEEIYKELLKEGLKIEEIERVVAEKECREELKESKQESQDRTISVTLIFAAIFIGLGIFSFIATNWQLMDKYLKLFVIIFFVALSYFTGWFLKEKKNFLGVSEAFFLVGSIIYGTGIFLITSVFEIQLLFPDGIIIWFLGSLLTGLIINSSRVINFSLLLGFVSAIAYPLFILGDEVGIKGYTAVSSIILLLLGFIAAIYLGISFDNKIKKINN